MITKNNLARPVFIDTNPTRVSERLRGPRFNSSPVTDEFTNTLPITISRYYTDVDGAVIAKALAPAALQVSFPAFVLGAYDMDGGFKIALQARPVAPGIYYLLSYVQGQALPFPYATGLNTVNAFISNGDIVSVFTDSIDAPNYYIYIVQSLNRPGTAGLGSVIKNLRTSKIKAKAIQMYSTNNAQFSEALKYITANETGLYIQDDVNPLSFKDPLTQYQNGFIDILTRFEMSHYFGIAFYFLYSSDSVSLNFKIHY